MPRYDGLAMDILKVLHIPHQHVRSVTIHCEAGQPTDVTVVRHVFEDGELREIAERLGREDMCLCPDGWPIIQTPMGSVAQIHHELCSITRAYREREEQALAAT